MRTGPTRRPRLRGVQSTGPGYGARNSADPTSHIKRSTELASARPLSELCLSGRAEKALLRHGIRTVSVLITWSRPELAREVIGLGDRSLDLIEAVLARHGLTLASEPEPLRAKFSPLTNSRHIRNHNNWLAEGKTRGTSTLAEDC
jgi:hypothetical protein